MKNSKYTFAKLGVTALIGLVLSCVWTMGVSQARAANGEGGININPLIMELSLVPGKSYDHKVTVSNSSKVSDFIVNAEAFDVAIEPETHNVKFFDDASKKNVNKSLAAWIVPESDLALLVESKEVKEYHFKIEVPAEAQSGNYYASVNFYFEAKGQQTKFGNVKVRQSIGTLMLVNVGSEGEEELHGAALDYEMSALELVPGEEETNLVINFFNNGLKYIHLRPLIQIVDAAGEVYYQKEGSSLRVFPGDKSTIESAFPNSYLAKANELTLNYSLVDKEKGDKYYEKALALSVLGDGRVVMDGFSVVETFKWLVLFSVMFTVLYVLLLWKSRRGLRQPDGFL